MQRTEKVIEIDAPVERVFDLFSDFESFPRWMSHIKEVRYTGRRYTRWTAEAPLGSSVEWEAETTRFEPDRLIAWRSVRGDVETQGEVTFRVTPRGTTLVRVRLGYDPPAGRLGALVARLFGTNPEQQLEEDLERFAEVVESRRRGRVRAREATRRREQGEDYGQRAERRPVAGRDDDERGRDWAERDRRYGPTEQRGRDEGGRRRLGDDSERAARGARGPAEERRLYERRMRKRPRERAERDEIDHRRRSSDQTPARYALTPRERESERTRRRPDYEYSRKAFSRGVDKLLDDDDAPSSRWRRW